MSSPTSDIAERLLAALGQDPALAFAVRDGLLSRKYFSKWYCPSSFVQYILDYDSGRRLFELRTGQGRRGAPADDKRVVLYNMCESHITIQIPTPTFGSFEEGREWVDARLLEQGWLNIPLTRIERLYRFVSPWFQPTPSSWVRTEQGTGRYAAHVYPSEDGTSYCGDTCGWDGHTIFQVGRDRATLEEVQKEIDDVLHRRGVIGPSQHISWDEEG